MTRVEVNIEQCAAIGKTLQKLTLKPKVFEGTCKGSLHEEYIKLWQPIVETHYY